MCLPRRRDVESPDLPLDRNEGNPKRARGLGLVPLELLKGAGQSFALEQF